MLHFRLTPFDQVNARLAKQEKEDGRSASGDPMHPKLQWPPMSLCPTCRHGAFGSLRGLGGGLPGGYSDTYDEGSADDLVADIERLERIVNKTLAERGGSGVDKEKGADEEKGAGGLLVGELPDPEAEPDVEAELSAMKERQERRRRRREEAAKLRGGAAGAGDEERVEWDDLEIFEFLKQSYGEEPPDVGASAPPVKGRGLWMWLTVGAVGLAGYTLARHGRRQHRGSKML